MKYEKIQTLWKRDAENNYCIIEDDFTREEFSNVRDWIATEKVDGQCITIIVTEDNIEIHGKKKTTEFNKAHEPLLAYINEKFTRDRLDEIIDFTKADTVVFYGEGYGPKIQKGGKYRDTQSFILFDIRIDGIWLVDIDEWAFKLGIENVPIFGRGPISSIVKIVKDRTKSLIEGADCIIEGIVARSVPLMLDRFGNRIIWKLKVKDYDQLERMENDRD